MTRDGARDVGGLGAAGMVDWRLVEDILADCKVEALEESGDLLVVNECVGRFVDLVV